MNNYVTPCYHNTNLVSQTCHIILLKLKCTHKVFLDFGQVPKFRRKKNSYKFLDYFACGKIFVKIFILIYLDSRFKSQYHSKNKMGSLSNSSSLQNISTEFCFLLRFQKQNHVFGAIFLLKPKSNIFTYFGQVGNQNSFSTQIQRC